MIRGVCWTIHSIFFRSTKGDCRFTGGCLGSLPPGFYFVENTKSHSGIYLMPVLWRCTLVWRWGASGILLTENCTAEFRPCRGRWCLRTAAHCRDTHPHSISFFFLVC